jgi:hypothetical protein
MNTLQDDLDIRQTENSMHQKSTHYFLNMDILCSFVTAINELAVSLERHQTTSVLIEKTSFPQDTSKNY